jgi:hypothetical protein
MRTFAKNPKAIQQPTSAKTTTPGRAHFGQSHEVNSILPLQRTIGNQAVQRMLDANTGDRTGDPTTTVIRRFGHDFSRIPVHSCARTFIQPKLTVNTHGDIYEQEADRVADMVMQAPDHGTPLGARDESDPEPRPSILGGQEKSFSRKGIEDEEDVPLKKGVVAEKCGCGEDDKRLEEKAGVTRSEGVGADSLNLDPEIETRIQAMRGDGRPLTSSERGFMEPRFGADFSAIRVHTNQEADTHSRALHARAFTMGSDIFFRAGEYEPGEAGGHRLLAHELTHSIQQGAARLNGPHIGDRSTAVALVQRQPDAGAPAPAPVAAPVGRAALNFLPVLQDQAPAGWGVTVNDDPVFDITAYADGGVWKCVITTADQQSHQGVRLMPGVVEVTPALVAAETSCPTLQTMITSLNSVANQGAHSGFYMLAAVQAHEDVHIAQYRAGLAPLYTTLKTAVEALTVPLAGNADAAAAKAAIKALPAFTAAMAAFHAGDVAVNNASGAHTPVAPFNSAEHGVVDPMIATIGARRIALKCPP